MTDIQHILYNTIGTTFEDYLDGSDLMTLSKVSNTTRDGDINVKFRRLLHTVIEEYDIFKTNNKSKVTYDLFFQHIPLRIIFKEIPTHQDILKLLDYLVCSNTTKIYIFIELTTLYDFREYISKTYNCDRHWRLIEQASIRNRPDIVQILFDRSLNNIPEHKKIYQVMITRGYNIDKYYYGTDELITQYNNIFQEFVVFIAGTQDKYIVLPNKGHLGRMLYYVTTFQEQYVLRNIYEKLGYTMPKWIDDVLNNTSLKYNLDRDVPYSYEPYIV